MVYVNVVVCIFPRTFKLGPNFLVGLGSHATSLLRIMPSDDRMPFLLGLADQALLHLFLKPNYVPLLAWNQTLPSP